MKSQSSNRKTPSKKSEDRKALRRKRVLRNRIIAGGVLLAFIILIILLIVIISNASKRKEEPVETTEETTEEVTKAPLEGFTVLLDAGHGFNDFGAQCEVNGSWEKEYTISVILMLRDKLENLGASVLLTHDGKSYTKETEILEQAEKLKITEKYPELQLDTEEDDNLDKYERVALANIWHETKGFDLFLSLHFDSSQYEDESGMSVYYCEDNPHVSELGSLAVKLCSSVKSSGLHDNTFTYSTAYDDSYVVVKYCDYPAILIEGGYLTNESDTEKIADDEWQEKFAAQLAVALADYFS